MASRFEIVDEKYIEGTRAKMKAQRIARSCERTFSKSERIKKIYKQVLSIQKFSNFALYVINKYSQWILIKFRINITCVLQVAEIALVAVLL